MKTPLVSICMPCHNAAKYVGQAVRSVLRQSWENIEVIIVNDSSTDQTAERLNSINDPRMHVITAECGNASAARNLAFQNSRGDFIKYFDADDIITPTMIESQLQRIVDSPGDIASCEWGRFYGNSPNSYQSNPESVWQDLPGLDWLINAWKTARPMMQPGLFLIPRDLIVQVGGWDESLTVIDDFEFFARLISATDIVRFTPEERLYYRSGLAGSLSQRKSRAAVESTFDSLLKGTSYLLKEKPEHAARQSCANLYQDFIHSIYPDYPNLRLKMEKEIQALGGSNLLPDGPPNFHRLRRLTGWKLARRIQKMARR
ncbi:MAG: glycosyltransferase family 2 protein [Verrucomicrobiales bacterium]|nr:glycosyltransferase family 2 protein [Verrucomicrobiales bacterium]